MFYETQKKRIVSSTPVSNALLSCHLHYQNVYFLLRPCVQQSSEELTGLHKDCLIDKTYPIGFSCYKPRVIEQKSSADQLHLVITPQKKKNLTLL